jgi:tripartite-type tricarboxylate transporter receptor subunit TctC
MMMRFRMSVALVVLAILLPAGDVAAQTAYPTKPVSLLIAFPPGGPSDVLSRIVGKKLEQILGRRSSWTTGPALAAYRGRGGATRRATATRC